MGTIGSFFTKALTAIVLFNLIYIVLGYIVNIFNEEINFITMLGSGWVFSMAVDFLRSLWSWIILVLSDAIALAVLFFIALVEEAYSTEWKK